MCNEFNDSLMMINDDRIIFKEVLRKEWMFKLVGDIKFTLGKQEAKCELRVDPIPYFCFCYSLYIDGKPLEKFVEKQNSNIQAWNIVEQGIRYRIVLEKQLLEIWLNGEKIEPEINFVGKGTEMKFTISGLEAILSSTIENNNKGIIYNLFVNNTFIESENTE